MAVDGRLGHQVHGHFRRLLSTVRAGVVVGTIFPLLPTRREVGKLPECSCIRYLQVAVNSFTLPSLKAAFPEITPFAEMSVTCVESAFGTKMFLNTPFA